MFDHTVWGFASDGDLEEGLSGEASSLAGTQEFGNLVLVYDANRISIEDSTSGDGEDLAAAGRALAAAWAETGRPSLFVLRTIIG